jgi:hypothetical protein
VQASDPSDIFGAAIVCSSLVESCPTRETDRRRQHETLGMLSWPASKKRQGTKSRGSWVLVGNGRYGDLMPALTLRVEVTPAGCGRRIRSLARLEARNGHLGKRAERINERTAHRPQRRGREGSLPA